MATMPNTIAQLYFESAEVLLVAISSDETLTGISKKGCEILGCKKHKVMGKNWFDNFVPEANREEARNMFHEMLKGKLRHVHYEHSIIDHEGKERIINWHNMLASDEKGKIIGIISSGSDVTKRRIAERKTKKVEDQLQKTLNSMQEGYQLIDYDWRYVYLNKAAAEQGRRSKDELIGRTMMEIYPGIDRTEMFSRLEECMKTRIPDKMENKFTYPDGSTAWFELHIEPAPEGIMILSLDITKRKDAEEELNNYRQRLEEVIAQRTSQYARAYEELKQKVQEQLGTKEDLKLRATILDNARESIFLLNSKGDFSYVNRAASETYGYTENEFLNMNIRQLVLPPEKNLIEKRFKDVLEKGRLDLQTIHVRKDKSLMPVQVRHSKIKTTHGSFIVMMMRDLTEKSKLMAKKK